MSYANSSHYSNDALLGDGSSSLGASEVRPGMENPAYTEVEPDEAPRATENLVYADEDPYDTPKAASGGEAEAAAAAAAAPHPAVSQYGASKRVLASPQGGISGAESARLRKQRASEEPIYGSNYQSYDDDNDAWGNRAAKYVPKKKNIKDVSDHLDAQSASAGSLTAVQVSLFGAAYDFMANTRGFVPQDALRFYLHHLQERRGDGNFVYMFSETQATDMMPSIEDAPNGMNYQQFMNVMYHVHQSSGWSAQKILTAFSRSDGHYGNHPGQLSEAMLKAQASKNGCAVM